MNDIPSTAAQVIVTVIPIVGIVMGSVVIFFFLLWNHRQKMLMIEKNLYKRPEFDLISFSLFSGLILTGIGASLVIFFVIKEGFSYGVLSGLIPFSIGVGLILFFIIRLRTFKENNGK